MRIGITGHVRLATGSEELIFAALSEALHRYPEVEGITCLAPGADQIFARAILARNGTYDVVLPALDYRGKIAADNTHEFDDLIAQARRLSILPYKNSSRPAYIAASRYMLARCKVLMAVWDQDVEGRSSCTSDIVALARRRSLEVAVVWPLGAQRANGRP